MLELTGMCCSGLDAVSFMESLADIFDDDIKTDDFCNDYEEALNRLRYLVAHDVGCKEKVHLDGKKMRYSTCGCCGFGVQPQNDFCPKCGKRILR